MIFIRMLLRLAIPLFCVCFILINLMPSIHQHTQVLAVSIQQQTTSIEVHLLDFKRRQMMRLTDLPGNTFPASWSPDGRYLLVNDFDRVRYQPFIIDLTNAQPTPLNGVDNVQFLTWSPDGAWIAYSYSQYSDSTIVEIQSPDGTQRRNINTLPYLSDLQWSPDGRYLLVSGADAGGHQAYDVQTGQMLNIALPITERVFWVEQGRALLTTAPYEDGTETRYGLVYDLATGQTASVGDVPFRSIRHVAGDWAMGETWAVPIRQQLWNWRTGELITYDIHDEYLLESPEFSADGEHVAFSYITHKDEVRVGVYHIHAAQLTEFTLDVPPLRWAYRLLIRP